MKNVWTIVNIASLENREGCLNVSISIPRSNFTKASRIFGRRERKTTNRRGANIAKASESHAYFSTGSFKNGSSPVKPSTLEID